MTSVSTAVAETAQEMHDELIWFRLDVILTPAPDPRHRGHMVRTVTMTNPGWYRQFCADHPSQRRRPRRSHKPDTAIKRAHTLRALQEIAGGQCATEYAHRLLPYVQKRVRNGKQNRINHCPIPAL